MNTKEILTKIKEKGFKVIEYKVTVEKAVELFKKGKITLFEGQRDFYNRKKDKAGFVEKILNACFLTFDETELVDEYALDGFNKSNEIAVLTNITFFISMMNKLFDGQHRLNWLMEFKANLFKVKVADLELDYKTLKEFYPEVCEIFDNFELKFNKVSTDDYDEVEEIFAAINTGSKNVTNEELVLSKMSKPGYTSVPLYKGLLNDDGTFFKYSPYLNNVYSNSAAKSFVRTSAYALNITGAQKYKNHESLEKFLENYKNSSKDNFLQSLTPMGKIHKALSIHSKRCKEQGKHFVKALSKYLYLNFTDIIENDFRDFSREKEFEMNLFLMENIEKCVSLMNKSKIGLDTTTDNSRSEKLYEIFEESFNREV